jgi:predicted permease
MLNSLLPGALFILLGIAWRVIQPNGVSAEALQKSVFALVHWVLLPLAVLLTLRGLPMNEAALRILLYVLAATLISLAIAWFWLSKTRLSGKTKGAFLIAAVFGSVAYLGMPLSKTLFPDWTMRVAIEYMLVANVLLLYTAGAILAKSLAEPGKSALGKSTAAVFRDYLIWLKEPVIWAAIIGLILNMAGAGLPEWAKQLSGLLYGALIPLLLLAVGLSLNWQRNWNSQLPGLLPVLVIQLAVVPLLMWSIVALFGPAGLVTTQVLLLNSMLPAAVIGFLVCERYKLDREAYAMAFTASSVLALVTVPIWYNVLL